VRVALVVAATAPVAMAKVAPVAPAGTITLAGTTAAALLLDRATVVSVGEAEPRVTVPVGASPSTTALALSVWAERLAGVTVSVAVCVELP
jgi:hypothetical protein